MRQVIRNKMNGVVNQYAKEAGLSANSPLLRANKHYGALSEIEEAAQNRNAMNQANRTLGLTDNIHGGIGAGAGAVIGAQVGMPAQGAVGAFGNKILRTYANPTLAYGMNRASAMLAGSPQVGRAVTSNPAIASTFLNQFGPAGQPEGATPAVPKIASAPEADRAPSGEARWARSGLEKLGIQDQALSERLLSDPKARELLIQASDLKPGSPALKRIQDQIHSKWGSQ
jgi:hypothetical protein